MPEPTVDLTISITNIDNREMLKDLLNSIRENTRRISYEIVVIDNVSKTAKAAMVSGI
jgi:GT2 family glycosyltransferase